MGVVLVNWRRFPDERVITDVGSHRGTVRGEDAWLIWVRNSAVVVVMQGRHKAQPLQRAEIEILRQGRHKALRLQDDESPGEAQGAAPTG